MDYKVLKRLRLGGHRDARALGLAAGSMMATHPFFSGLYSSMSAAPLGGLALGAIAGGALGQRIIDAFGSTAFFESEIKIRSSAPPVEWPFNADDGLMIGYCVDSGKPVFIPYEDVMRHGMIVGQSGVGKTVLGEFIMYQQIMNGGGLLFIDPKLDSKNLAAIRAYCTWAGREQDLIVINPGKTPITNLGSPSLRAREGGGFNDSNTYNPILYGDSDEVASRCLALIPSTESSAGADFYKQAANQGLTTLVAAIQRAGLAYNFIDLTILLMNQKALAYLESVVPPSKEKTNLTLFLEQYRVTGKDGATSIDMKRLKETFGGIGGRLFSFGTGSFGDVTNSYTPEAKLFDAIRGNKIVYVMLPTMGKDVAATNFAKMAMADLRTAISWCQSLPESDKPWPPFLAFVDEAGSIVNQSWSRKYEQSRSAHVALWAAVQTVANLEDISPQLKEMVLGNSWTKIWFKLGTQDTAEQAANLIGMEKRVQDSLSASGGAGTSSRAVSSAMDTGKSENANFSIGEREIEDWKVSPDDLKSLGKGEAIVTFGGSRVYHVRIPRLQMGAEALIDVGETRLNHWRGGYAKGLDLFNRSKRFLLAGDDD